PPCEVSSAGFVSWGWALLWLSPPGPSPQPASSSAASADSRRPETELHENDRARLALISEVSLLEALHVARDGPHLVLEEQRGDVAHHLVRVRRARAGGVRLKRRQHVLGILARDAWIGSEVIAMPRRA